MIRKLTGTDGSFDGWPGPVRAGLWMSASALLYACSSTVVRHLAQEMPTFEIVFLRNMFALLFMVPWLMRVGAGVLATRRLELHFTRGLTSMINVSCQVGALALIPVADMAAISFLQPVFGSAIAIIALGEASNGRRWSAVILGFIGAMLIIRPGFETVNVGIGLAMGSALMGSVVAIMIKYMLRTETPDAVAAYLFIFQAIISLVPALLVWQDPTWPQLGWLAVMGLLSLGLQRTFNRAMLAADATVALPFNFTRLIWASALGFVVFSEVPDAWTWIGGAVIFAASIQLSRREARGK